MVVSRSRLDGGVLVWIEEVVVELDRRLEDCAVCLGEIRANPPTHRGDPARLLDRAAFDPRMKFAMEGGRLSDVVVGIADPKIPVFQNARHTGLVG